MSDTNPQPEFITCNEFMAACGISKATLRRYMRIGAVGSSQPFGKGGKVLIPRSEIERLKNIGKSINDPTPKRINNRLAGRRPAWLDDEVGPDENNGDSM